MGLLTKSQAFTPNEGEVAEVFDVPLSHALDRSNFLVEGRMWQGAIRKYYTAPYGPYYFGAPRRASCKASPKGWSRDRQVAPQPASQAVMLMLTSWLSGVVCRGCVRNALLGEPVSDLDISTDARPETVMSLAEVAGLKAVPTGIDHGTITVISGGQPYEITTFRRDVETDGRRAVGFADTFHEDAQRRDFTMNALYADASGSVADPLVAFRTCRPGTFALSATPRRAFVKTSPHSALFPLLRVVRADLDPEACGLRGAGGIESPSRSV